MKIRGVELIDKRNVENSSNIYSKNMRQNGGVLVFSEKSAL